MTLDAHEFIERQRERWSRKPWIVSKDIQRNGRHFWRREAVTFHVQSNYRQKVLIVERLRYDRWEPAHPGAKPIRERAEGDEIEYRVGYFIVSRTGKWWWGQFAPFIPSQDFEELIQKARDEGTILPVVTSLSANRTRR